MKRDLEWYRNMQYSAIGIEMAAAVAVGGLIGYWLDEYFGTAPWLLFFWLMCGLVAGFRSLYRLTMKVKKQQKEDEIKRSE